MISVIIPVYNVREYIGKCVDSVLKQKIHDIEIILVDDGSTDGSDEVCDMYADANENVFVIHKKNAGLGYARNSGLEIARGEYIFFLDSDDWLPENALINLQELAENNDVDIICFRYARTSERDNFVLEQPIREDRVVNNEELMKEYLAGMTATACTKLYKKEIFEKEKFSNVPIHEDSYSMHLFLKNAKRAMITNQIYYIQYIRKGSLTQTIFTEKNFICIECGERLVKFAKEYYPMLVDYAYFNCLERRIYTLDLMISSDKHSEMKKEFMGIIGDIKKEITIIEKVKTIDENLFYKAVYICQKPKQYIIKKKIEVSFYKLRIILGKLKRTIINVLTKG